MKQRKAKPYIIIPVLALVLILVNYFYNFRIGSYLHPDETAYTMSELTHMVTAQINAAKEKERY